MTDPETVDELEADLAAERKARQKAEREGPVHELARCPHCDGSVVNVASGFGPVYGLLERAINPQLRCARCGAAMEIGDLPESQRFRLARRRRTAFVFWAMVMLLAFGYLAAIAISSPKALH